MTSEKDNNCGVSDEHHSHHVHPHHHRQQETHQDPPLAQHGTFQGVPNYPTPRPPQSHPHPYPAMGFPRPVPPPGAINSSNPSLYYAHGYQTVPGYAIAEGRPVKESRLPCCGMGFGWFLFIIGFFLGAIPWYVGAIILACGRFDYREKPGYVTCTIAAILATIAVIFGATEAFDVW